MYRAAVCLLHAREPTLLHPTLLHVQQQSGNLPREESVLPRVQAFNIIAHVEDTRGGEGEHILFCCVNLAELCGMQRAAIEVPKPDGILIQI